MGTLGIKVITIKQGVVIEVTDSMPVPTLKKQKTKPCTSYNNSGLDIKGVGIKQQASKETTTTKSTVMDNSHG